MNDKKQELQVAALENGTVIDHIPSENLFTVVSLPGIVLIRNSSFFPESPFIFAISE